MAKAANGTPQEGPTRLRDLRLEQVASLAADALVKLHMDGKAPDASALPQALWRACRMKGDGSQVQPFFRQVLTGPVFLKLVEIRMRRATLSDLADNVSFIKNLAADLLKLAGDALVEDLLLHPAGVRPNDKRMIFQGAAEVFDRLTPKELPQSPEQPKALEEAAIEIASEMEQTVARLPKEMQDRVRRQWKLDKLTEIEQVEAQVFDGSGLEQTSGGV